jgi:phosphoglycerate dehydrogenase-like enzyme
LRTGSAETVVRVLNTFPLPAAARGRLEAVSPRLEIEHRPLQDPERVPKIDDPELEVLLSSHALDGRLPSLRWLQIDSVGVEHLPRDDLRRRGVVVTNASGVYSAPIAEYILCALLYAAQNIPGRQAAQRGREWRPDPVRGRMLRGQTVVIVGYGSIGRAVARLLNALGARVIAVRARPEFVGRETFHEDGAEDAEGAVPDRILGPQELVSAACLADYLVLALPGTRETRGLVNAHVIESLPAHAWVVNVGRGSAVVESALAEALSGERLGGAILDVFAEEPLPRGSPFWTLPNVLVTPHVAGFPRDDVLVELLVENLRRYVEQRPLLNVVDLVRGY